MASTADYTGSQHLTDVLQVRGVSKAFPGVQALRKVSMEVHAGEIHALVGENGAGKSTLVKLLSGLYAPDEGEILVCGQRIIHFDPRLATRLGIAVVHQHADLFPSLSGLENLFAGDLLVRHGRVDWRRMRDEASLLLDDLGMEVDLSCPLGELRVAERQQIQIARALRRRSKVLVLDEPTAALGGQECEALFALLKRLASEGLAIIYISHRLEEVFRLADRITVLRDGEKVGTVLASQTDRAQIVAMMVGREISDAAKRNSRARGEAVLRVRDLSANGALEGVSLSLHAGEILGISGLQGSGKTELVRALCGLIPVRRGEASGPDGVWRRLTPELSRRLNIAFIPGDRHEEAVILGMNVRENTTLSVLGELSTAWFPRRADEERLTLRMVKELDVRAASIEQPLATLSGGNQQKVALARRLAAQPRVLILEEPTQGVDVAARASIHRIILDLADSGVAVLLASSDLTELLSLSDRIAVMQKGRIAGVFERHQAAPQRIMEIALGSGAPVDKGAEAISNKTVSEGRKRLRVPMREAALAVVLAVLASALALRDPAFTTTHNLMGILVSSSHLAICAAGMTAVIVAGAIDVSVGSMLATICMLLGLMLNSGLPTAVACVASVLIGGAMGAANGALSTWLRVPPIVATLGTRSIWRGVAMKLTDGDWITDLPYDFELFSDATVLGIPLSVLIAGICLGAVAFILGHTRLGRAGYAVGDNRVAAYALGLRPRQTQFLAFGGLGLLVGIASIVYAGTNPPIQPNAAPNLEMATITAVMIGGTNIFGGSGSILGTIMGVLVLGVIGNGLTLAKVDEFWAQALQGALILGAVMADILRRRFRRGGDLAQ